MTATPRPAVAPVLVNFADHAEQLRLTVHRALKQTRALAAGWHLEADEDNHAEHSTGTALDLLAITLETAHRSAEIVERRVRAATEEGPTS